MNDTGDHDWSKIWRRRYGVGVRVPVRGETVGKEGDDSSPAMARGDQGEADRLSGDESSTPIA